MDIKEKMQEQQLKVTIGTEQEEKLGKMICVLSQRGCREARFEVGNKDSEFTSSELRAFCESHNFGLVGIKEGGVCLPSNVEEGMLYMTF